MVEIMHATPDQARVLTDRIRVGLEATWQLIVEAWEVRAWASLGYSSWDDYCRREFGNQRLQLPREERTEQIQSMREAGMSIRAIASATGAGIGTVHSDLANVSYSHDRGVQNRTPGVEDAECLAELDRTPRLREMVTDSSRIGRAAKLPGSLVAVLQFAFEEIDEDDSAYFFNKLETGENLSANDPIHVLRGQLDRLDSSHGTVNKTYLMALVIKAWNAFREGREISMLKFRPGGASPEAFPTPK